MLSQYHQKYSDKPDKELELRAKVKEHELVQIFSQVQLDTNSEVVRIAVMGCGDKRFVKSHEVIFEKLLQKPIELNTFDITIEHLQSESNIFQHDCTIPLPNPPYDITYAHVLLKFIEPSKQWSVVENSYNALKDGGLAIHVLDQEDYDPELPLKDGHKVNLSEIEQKLSEKDIRFQKIIIKSGPKFETDCMAMIIIK